MHIIGSEHHRLSDLKWIALEMWRFDIRDILEDSCFYYCSGSDITPIIAFEGSVHSFIYCDSCIYDDFATLSGRLKARLRERGFEEVQKTFIDLSFFRLHERDLEDIQFKSEWKDYGNRLVKSLPTGDFSIWRTKSHAFSLIFLRWHDICVWMNLFERYQIFPKVICNSNPEDSLLYDEVIAKHGQPLWNERNRPEYVIGHPNKFGDEHFEEIGTVEYLGDYAPNSGLYRRIKDTVNVGDE